MKPKDVRKLVEWEKRLVENAGEDAVILFPEVRERLKTRAIISPIKSSYPALDHYVEGFEPGELVVVSGRAKSGKTLFLQSLTRNFAKDKYGVCWFNYELTTQQFMRCFPPSEVDDYCSMSGKMKGADLNWIEERICEAKLKYDIKIVMIDHLHFLVDMARMRNPSLEIGSVLRRLKGIAIDNYLVVFLICHMGKAELGKEPTGNDIRDSSFALQEPDTILIIWRVKDEGDQQDEARLKIELTRRTGVRQKTFKLKKINGYLEEITERSYG